MLLAEELVLLLVPKAVGAVPRSGGTHTAVAGAVLIELADAGQLEVTDDWVTVLQGDGHPLAPDLGDGTFDEVVRAIVPDLYWTGALITLLHELRALRPVFRAQGPILRADTVANGAWAVSPATVAMVTAVTDRLRFPPGDFQVGGASLG